MKKKTQFQILLAYLLQGKSISNREYTDMFRRTGSSFHRLIGEIERKFNIELHRWKKGEGSDMYYNYTIMWEDRRDIKELLKTK